MRYLLTLFILFNTAFSFGQKKNSNDAFVKQQPVPHKAVNDFSKLLTLSERTTLELDLSGYLIASGNAVVFISLDSLTDPKTKKQYTIEEAALLYFNTWGIGDSIKNNGVLLMVSRNPRKVRIQVGKGLETVLTNDDCQKIIDNKLVPNFKKGLFFTGINEAVKDIKFLLDKQSAVIDRSSTTYTVTTEESFVDKHRRASNIVTGIIVVVFIGVIAMMGYFILVAISKFRNKVAAGSSGLYANRQGNNFIASDDSHVYDSGNSGSSSNDNASFAAFSSSPSIDSSSSSPASCDTSSGGSSDGGGASGNW
jgi:uncharacterized protein